MTKPQGKPPILDAYLLLAGKASKLPSNYGAKRFSWTWPKCDELIEVQGQISKVFWEVFEESLYNKRKMLRELCG